MINKSDYVLTTKQLRKSFTVKKKTVEAVKGVDISVRKGQIFGFLGPNGAGKTTTLRMLATLLPIDSGEAIVVGYDVKKQPKEVRKHIGYVSQLGGSDDQAIGIDDLILQGRLYGMTRQQAIKRAKELVGLLQLGDFVDRKVMTYSGGQKRRLDIAAGIMHKPDVLFLDEPTTGLDPQNRANLWDQIRELRDSGTTIFLTTHYLEEADALADELMIMDHGKIVAEGTPRELKKEIAGDAITVRPKKDGHTIEQIQKYLFGQAYVREASVEDESIRLYVEDGTEVLPKIFALLEAKKVGLDTVSLSQASLDDVFLKKTGRSLRDGDKKAEGASR
ncbi:MAG TPA: ATP-binding cassette domain-containing protein [Candidatus Saccharimonadales bacterium]|nr:ATP-binding cassette domain-containing protein [Candidatus Saccharimonadales bacterium]